MRSVLCLVSIACLSGCLGQVKQSVRTHASNTLVVADTIDRSASVIDCDAMPEALAKRTSCTIALRTIGEQTTVLRQSAAQLGASAGPAPKASPPKPAPPPVVPAAPAAPAPAPAAAPPAPAAPAATVAPVHP